MQVVWSTAQGRPLEATDALTGEQIVRRAAHVDPILVLLAPAWWAYPSPHALILVQAIALASGVYPVVRLALKYAESERPGRHPRGLVSRVSLDGLESANRCSSRHLRHTSSFIRNLRVSSTSSGCASAVFATLALMTGELVGLDGCGAGNSGTPSATADGSERPSLSGHRRGWPSVPRS